MNENSLYCPLCSGIANTNLEDQESVDQNYSKSKVNHTSVTVSALTNCSPVTTLIDNHNCMNDYRADQMEPHESEFIVTLHVHHGRDVT
jgi:hypothetical protein